MCENVTVHSCDLSAQLLSSSASGSHLSQPVTAGGFGDRRPKIFKLVCLHSIVPKPLSAPLFCCPFAVSPS